MFKYLINNKLNLLTILLLLAFGSLIAISFPPKQIESKNIKEALTIRKNDYRGTTVDMSQILPESDNYVVNNNGEDLIDISAKLNINIFRITNIQSMYKNKPTETFSDEQWGKVLNKMEQKGIDAIILIEANETDKEWHNETLELNDYYINFLTNYLKNSNICSHPNVIAIDIRNEPVINSNNLYKLKEASNIVKSQCPKMQITVGSWRTDTGEKYASGVRIYNWHDPKIAPQLNDIVDFYSTHIYSFDIPVNGEFPDPYTRTVNYINHLRQYTSGKPIMITEFGAGNGSTKTDQGTLGNEEVQRNAYVGVFKAVNDLKTKNVLGAISYVLHSRSGEPDGWNIIKNNGDTLLPASQTFNRKESNDEE